MRRDGEHLLPAANPAAARAPPAIAGAASFGKRCWRLSEAPALDPGSIDVAHTQKELERSGIGITFSLGLDADTDISSGDPEKARRGKARLEEAIAVARDLNATHVCGILHSAFQKYAVPTTSDGVKSAVEVLQQVAETAARMPVGSAACIRAVVGWLRTSVT